MTPSESAGDTRVLRQSLAEEDYMDILTQLRAERGKVTRPFKCRAPRFSPERLGPRLWKSHVESHLGGRSFPPTIDSAQHIDRILLCEHPARCESAQSTPAV